MSYYNIAKKEIKELQGKGISKDEIVEIMAKRFHSRYPNSSIENSKIIFSNFIDDKFDGLYFRGR